MPKALFQVEEMSVEEVQSELANPAKGYEERAPYREALKSLEAGKVVRIHPSDETDADGKLLESSRAIKFRIIGASKETGVNVKYGEDAAGDILVWLDTTPPDQIRPRRTNKGKRAAAELANGTADADILARETTVV